MRNGVIRPWKSHRDRNLNARSGQLPGQMHVAGDSYSAFPSASCFLVGDELDGANGGLHSRVEMYCRERELHRVPRQAHTHSPDETIGQ